MKLNFWFNNFNTIHQFYLLLFTAFWTCVLIMVFLLNFYRILKIREKNEKPLGTTWYLQQQVDALVTTSKLLTLSFVADSVIHFLRPLDSRPPKTFTRSFLTSQILKWSEGHGSVYPLSNLLRPVECRLSTV